MAHHLVADATAFDLDAYFARIGYSGPREPTLDVLHELHLRHATSIPFENLSPLLGWPVRLDTASLMRKLLHERRGGYCFEQNLLLAHALDALGFRFTGLAARVVYNMPLGTVTARGHMLLAVEGGGGTMLADVGFGGLTLTGPLVLTPDVEQVTPHEPFRLTMTGAGQYQLEALVRDVWTPLYRFTPDEAYLADYEMASWYLCHAPGSHFTTGLIAARPSLDSRYTLRNTALTTHHSSGRTDREVLTGASALRAALEGPIGVRVPASPDVEAMLERISAAGAAAPIS